LPNSPGVYYFKDEKEPLFTWVRPLHIKKTGIESFYEQGHQRNFSCCKAIHDIDFELSGSELGCLIKWSRSYKKQHFPSVQSNVKKRTPSGICYLSPMEDRKRHTALGLPIIKIAPILSGTFNNIKQM